MGLKQGVFRRKSSLLHFLVLILTFSFSPPPLHAAQEPAATTFSKKELPARGRQESILTVSKFGRYALLVKSDQGTGIQLVDRMAGPGEIAGSAGEKDGRLDLFLERGKYKVVTYGHDRSAGKVHLEVHPFVESNSPEPPTLVKLRHVDGALKDFEQRSYWLEIKERRQVAIEAAGRSLAEMRLWKDGQWLLDVSPSMSTVQPKTGQPLRICRLVADLEPGLYLLSAYGGNPLPWADDDGLHPFYIRYGIPELGSATRKRFTVSPFGTDHFVVPGAGTYFRLELPKAEEASIQVGWFDENASFSNGGDKREIRKNSVPPVAEIQTSGNKDAKHIVSVTGEAGTPYILQQFESSPTYSFQGTGDYWISSVHSGHPQDSIDATAIMTSGYDTQHAQPKVSQTIEMDLSKAFSRRANLLGPLTLFLKVNAAGSYLVGSEGVEARFVVEPFLTFIPPNYSRPAAQPGGHAWDLDPGYYVLTVEPVKKGIADIFIRPNSLTNTVLEKMELKKGVEAGPLHAAVRFSRVRLNHNTWYTVYMNAQPDVKKGLVVRSLPLDLTDPLPVTQALGETVSVPFQTSEDGTLRGEAEDGSSMELSLDNGPWQQSHAVAPGLHTVSVRTTSKDTINYSLMFEPHKLNAKTPLPRLSREKTDGLPTFPVLTENMPQFFDLERNSSSTFAVRADRPGLYHIQSTGLLATGGNLRSRTAPSLVRESENGAGRNFSIRQYLREGDYQVTVDSKGLSKGHLGMSMQHSRPVQGGYLTNRIPARISLPAGTSAMYHFIITIPGEFRVRAFGLGGAVRCRLEDKDGWPVMAPNIASDITRWFEKGRYRLIILPENTDARVLTLIEPTPAPRRYSWHGPHKLPLAAAVEHAWMEPETGSERLPDQWRFDLPAASEVQIELTGEMQADLVRINSDNSTTRTAFIPPARGWKGRLDAGTYRIDAVSMRINNRLPYRVAVGTTPLMAGMSREITVPSTVPVAVGHDGLMELSSFGPVDVKARLTTDDGTVVAASDDRPDDWNFHIAVRVKPGNYRLFVEPVGAKEGSCTVSARIPREEEVSPAALPVSTKIRLSGAVKILPLVLPEKGELLVLSAIAPENVSMALERAGEGGWKTIGSSFGRNARMEVPLRDPGSATSSEAYRLRMWSMDRRETVAELSAALVSPPVFSEADLKEGIPLSSSPKAAAVVKVDRGGLLQLPDEHRGLHWAVAQNRQCEAAPDGFLAVRSGYLWVTGEPENRQAAPIAKARRVTLGPGEDNAIQLRLPDDDKTLCDIASPVGGPVLFIASSRVGRSAVEVAEQGGEGAVNVDTMVIGEHSSIGVSLTPEKPVARLWHASGADGPFETRFTAFSFKEPERLPLPDGGNGLIAGGKASILDLPKGDKRIRLSLGEAVAAVFIKEGRAISTHWAEGNSFTETFASDAERMLLLNTGEGEGRFAVESVPTGGTLSSLSVAAGKPYERFMSNSGRVRLRIAPGKEGRDELRRLHVRGAIREPIFTDMNGRAASGRDLRIGPRGGTLTVEHQAGALLCWLDRPEEEALDLWAYSEKPVAPPITLPASLALEGDSGAYRINAGKPVMLHVRGATPLVSYLDRGDKTPEVEVFSTAVVIDSYLPEGTAELRLRAFSGVGMAGHVDIYTSPVIPTDEGLGPEVLLAPGGARLFSFKVAREGKVGVGVKADSDLVEMEILNNDGLSLGKGSAQMLDLKPGTYLVKVQSPDGSAPVRARPAIVGLKAPDTSPPHEEVQKYLLPEDETPRSYSSRRTMGAPGGYEGDGEEGAPDTDVEPAEETYSGGEPDSAEGE